MSYQAKKRFGQNFLTDKAVLHRIFDCLKVHANDCVLEIGPGLGALTQTLASQVACLDLVEIDRELAQKLQIVFEQTKHVRIHNEDILKFNLDKISPASEKIRVIGNLPYNISTPLLFHLFKFLPIVKDIHVMLQKEVAERLVATPGTRQYGRLSVMAQVQCQIDYLFGVDATAFDPKPEVESAFIKLVPQVDSYAVESTDIFEEVVRLAFSQRRKTLKNTLKSLVSADEMIQLGISPQARAETLSIEDFAQLSDFVAKRIHQN